MAKKAKVHSTTQSFTEVVDIVGDTVFFKNKSAVSIIEVSSVNFFLLSADEQNARIYGYMSFLNSLSFAVQIVIISKRVDMSSYLKLLDARITNVQNPRIKEHLTLYKEFIQELIKGEGLLDKKIYVVIPFSSLELGAVKGVASKKESFTTQTQNVIASKRSTIVSQLERMGLASRVLAGNELVKLFYEIFNEQIITLDFNSRDVKNIIL